MTVSHKAVEETTHASALERSPAYVEARRSATDLIDGWEAYEQGLHRLFKAAECGTIAGNSPPERVREEDKYHRENGEP